MIVLDNQHRDWAMTDEVLGSGTFQPMPHSRNIATTHHDQIRGVLLHSFYDHLVGFSREDLRNHFYSR
jgi:hypothetical protein